jgi:hypothetical protein
MWLLFVDKNSQLETMFANISIPLDCEFLVAQKEDDYIVVLIEVYCVSASPPLQTRCFGERNSPSGLTLPTASFYQRRNNLQELQFKDCK